MSAVTGIDEISRVMFPIGFGIFSVTYWLYYLNIRDVSMSSFFNPKMFNSKMMDYYVIAFVSTGSARYPLCQSCGLNLFGLFVSQWHVYFFKIMVKFSIFIYV
jgi:hypothetical protein